MSYETGITAKGEHYKRYNLEFLSAWFDALRRRDTEAMTAALDPDA